jgi:hypothetical protein
VCTSEGRWAVVRDCTEWGSTCGLGVCDDACGVAEQRRLNVGCIFHPVPLANFFEELDGELFDFRVAVANPNAAPATVTVTRGTRQVTRLTIAPGRMELVVLPWIEDQSDGLARGRFEGLLAPEGLYRLTSDQPVTVFQFNPFEYEVSGQQSWTNDATVLFPTHALTGDYVAASYAPLGDQMPGYVVVGAVDAEPTTVRITSPTALAAERDGAWARAEPGEELVLTLAPGELAYLVHAEPCGADAPPDCTPGVPDLTGTRVRADRPVVAFGGHLCANVPTTAGTCDHLEAQLPPIETLGARFTSAPLVAPDSGHRNLVRVVAAFDGTTIASEPPLELHRPGQGRDEPPVETLDAGEWAEAFVDAPFSISTSEPVMVAQYLLGSGDPPVRATRGDPSMTLLVPEEQHTDGYVFSSPDSYRPAAGGQSYVLLVREPGAAVTLDGQPVPGPWTEVAGRQVRLLEVDGGIHRLEADAPLGAMVYGLGKDTSYAYPAGLDLERIVDPF